MSREELEHVARNRPLAPLRSLTSVYICTYDSTVGYEWDQRKAAANLDKHGVDFADAVIALEDDLALTMSDPGSYDEERFVSLGTDAAGRLLVVI